MDEMLKWLAPEVVSKLDKYAEGRWIKKPEVSEPEMETPESSEMEISEKVMELKAMPWYDPIAIIKLLIS